jgi:ankyrin repeat protein
MEFSDEEGMALPTVLKAVRDGEIATVNELLSQGYDPNTPVGDDGELLLCWAASYGHVPIVELLIAQGADVDAVPSHGLGGPALSDAIFEGHMDAARLLAKAGAQVDYPHAAALGLIEQVRDHDETHEERWSAFLAACKTGQLEVVQYLVPRGIDLEIYPPGSEYGGIGASGLHYAASCDHPTVVEWLVVSGTPVDIVDDAFENTPLGWALLDGNDLVAELLLRLGADPSLAQR